MAFVTWKFRKMWPVSKTLFSKIIDSQTCNVVVLLTSSCCWSTCSLSLGDQGKNSELLPIVQICFQRWKIIFLIVIFSNFQFWVLRIGLLRHLTGYRQFSFGQHAGLYFLISSAQKLVGISHPTPTNWWQKPTFPPLARSHVAVAGKVCA